MPAMPVGIRACLFDLDGVLTQTDLVHTAAWQEIFDTFLRRRAGQSGQPFAPFDPVSDYGRYVDGKPRADGARSFLASRGIELPEGSDDDDPAAETVRARSNTKNAILLRRIEQDGVRAYPGPVRYLRPIAAPGRPPDTCLAAAWMPDISPAAGRRGGRAGGSGRGPCGRLGWVVGVDRMGQADALAQAGADIVVQDLAELVDEGPGPRAGSEPSAQGTRLAHRLAAAAKERIGRGRQRAGQPATIASFSVRTKSCAARAAEAQPSATGPQRPPWMAETTDARSIIPASAANPPAIIAVSSEPSCCTTRRPAAGRIIRRSRPCHCRCSLRPRSPKPCAELTST